MEELAKINKPNAQASAKGARIFFLAITRYVVGLGHRLLELGLGAVPLRLRNDFSGDQFFERSRLVLASAAAASAARSCASSEEVSCFTRRSPARTLVPG